MDTKFLGKRGVDMDTDTEFLENRGVDMDMDMDTEFFEKRGVDMDMDTAWNRAHLTLLWCMILKTYKAIICQSL